MNNQRNLKIILLLSVMFFTLVTGVNTHASIKTYHQHGYALKGGYATHFLHNKNYAYVPKYIYGSSKDYYKNNTHQTQSETIKAIDGNYRRNAHSSYYLPVSGNMANSQSVAVSSDGHYAYVMYPDNANSVVRYDLGKLQQQGVNTTNMDALRNGVRYNDPNIMSAVKMGPHFDVKHGQSLAINPKTGQLWFHKMDLTTKKPTLEEINPNTLKPVKQIKYTFSNRYSINNELAIDKRGNFYTYVKYRPTRTSGGRLVIFKGRVKHNHVSFRAIKQGLLNSPGVQTQGMGYNPAKNRLYFVSDGVITSVPVNRLNHLRKRDVHTTKFKTKLEFEGIAFNAQGLGYLLTIRGSQLSTIHDF